MSQATAPIPRPPGVRPGRPAPWASLGGSRGPVTVADVAAALRAGPPARRAGLELPGAKASAVLAALFDEGGQARVVLTRRSRHLRSHRGEVSFPGGRREPGEALWQTALREAYEEVGLPAAGVRLIGELDHRSTVVNPVLFIVPFVATLERRPALQANPGEVDRVFDVALDELLDPAVYREERWRFGPVEHPVWFFEVAGETVWGATAAMLRDLLVRVVGVDGG